ncbi:polycomb group RING finger protein 6-like [Peromyscus eremicus]|uniref:polycomb group RING finger protein 6-like n=1 Tax=Peromyscus eremicus TaxID=42410 RepID=UPI0027DDB8A1|nr:polycomb group RING finger protein 6-like [Peromyscus eremicus]XP_059106685.1 polycomb group RING finger protein 6-like [Peromyscus eremicus]
MESDLVDPEGSLDAATVEGATALSPPLQAPPAVTSTARSVARQSPSAQSKTRTQDRSGSRLPNREREGASREERLVPLSELTPYISCSVCKGYLIDATTVTECLHAFCKSCIIKHFELSNRCPKCNIVVHEAKPHNHLRSDPQLQAIVYKLVAGLEEKEKKQRQEFYKGNYLETPKPDAVPQPSPSSEGNTEDLEELCLSSHEPSISLVLESMGTEHFKPLQMKFVQISGNTTIGQIEKFLKRKMGLAEAYRVAITCGGQLLKDFQTLQEVQCTVGDAGMQGGLLVLYYSIVLSPLNVTC